MSTHINVATTIGRQPVYVLEDLGDLVITVNFTTPWDAKKYMLTHRATGYGITTHNNRRELRTLARTLLRNFDLAFTDPEHARTMTDAPYAIAAWRRKVAK